MARSAFRTSSDFLTGSSRSALFGSQRGFTIVELLIVIVVIAILAAITIVAYNGVAGRAIDASMKSDLQGTATTLGLDHATDNAYPADAASANGGQGLKASGDNLLAYRPKPYGFCVSISNPRSSKTFALKSSTNQIEEGNCDVTVSTLAGSGTSGSTDGTGSAARFYYPFGVTVDATGKLYVADTYNYRVREITAGGAVSTFVGSTWGYLDGTGTSARFKDLHYVAVDASGTMFVADTFNHRIRTVSQGGAVTPFAGSGTQGSVDGTGVSAQFSGPRDIAIDPLDNLYVTEASSHRIRKITPAGVVSTLAGSTQGYADGTGAAAQFNNPTGIAVDASGNVYVGDAGNHRIRKITPAGVVTTLAGSTQGYADGTSAAAQFYAPCDVAVDSLGNVYVTDVGNHRIRVVTPSGVVTTLAGSTQGYADGVGAAAQFNSPNGLAIDATNTVYVADTDNHRIRKITQ